MTLECPPAEGAPTLSGELKRGVNPYNLTFGAVASLCLGGGTVFLASHDYIPDMGLGAWGLGLAVVVGLFILFTAMHTFAHGLMGWVFERGLALHCQGDLKSARRWLALAERPGMDHYDPNGIALEALRDCRRQLA